MLHNPRHPRIPRHSGAATGSSHKSSGAPARRKQRSYPSSSKHIPQPSLRKVQRWGLLYLSPMTVAKASSPRFLRQVLQVCIETRLSDDQTHTSLFFQNAVAITQQRCRAPARWPTRLLPSFHVGSTTITLQTRTSAV